MARTKNVVIRVTPKQAERWREAARLAGSAHYTSWARKQVDAAVRSQERRRRKQRPPGPGKQGPATGPQEET